MTPLAPLLQAFFSERLVNQRHASPHTIASYRDSFRLLLAFVHQQTAKTPSKLQLEDLDAARIAAFLGHVEHERGNSVRTRNARLTAIHSFFHYAALQAPDQAELIARVLGIPEKRFANTLISYLDEPEIDALLASPDRSTWTGRRDHALLLLAVQTGLRASELASLRRQDLQLGTGAWVRCEGKAERKGALRSAGPPGRYCASGCTSAAASPPARCSPTAAVSTSRAARSGDSSSSTPRPQTTGVRRSPQSTSHRTCCAIPQRCGCCTPRHRSTPRRSRCGSAMRRSTRPTSTSTPTWCSNNARSTAPHHRTRNPAATARPTRCSRSSRASRPPRYVEPTRPIPANRDTSQTTRNIIPRAT